MRKSRWLLILLLLIVLVALSACGDSGNGDISGAPAKMEKQHFPPTDTKKGWIELLATDGISSQDNLPCVYEEAESIEKLEVHMKELSTTSLTYIYIDGHIVQMEQGGGELSFQIQLSKAELKKGIHELAAVQYQENNPETKKAEFLKRAKYKVKQIKND
ncbi:superoxide dismutase [Listeria marthii]|uniref:superoxide dismutase n=1 Tax=Listeria marthii TaxID=529731 RepID=UPI001629584D|nr:superoxide dismutase [Listeria marthii]MBC2121178.1 superoxide dismutase [Listeria marthii]